MKCFSSCHFDDIFSLSSFTFSSAFSEQHMEKIVSLGEEAHLNTCIKHFNYFIEEFELVDRREMAPLQEVIDAINEKASES